jgi:hypothetical protein
MEVIAKAALAPDAFTTPVAPQELHSTEAPDHYLDLELIEGIELPPARYEFLALLGKKDLKPSKVGLLPYAINESFQRLAVAMAHHRRWPADEAARQQCLLYAGILAHYAQDACQPLHTTVNFDGRIKDSASPRSGIHLKVDALLGKTGLSRQDLAAAIKLPKAPADGFSARQTAMDAIKASHELVDLVYELEPAIPKQEEPIQDDKVRQFAVERLKAAAQLTAELYQAAWVASAEIKIPDWPDLKELYGDAKAVAPTSRPAKQGTLTEAAPEQTIVREGEGGDSVTIENEGGRVNAHWQGGKGKVVVTTAPGRTSVSVTVQGGGQSSASSSSSSGEQSGGD